MNKEEEISKYLPDFLKIEITNDNSNIIRYELKNEIDVTKFKLTLHYKYKQTSLTIPDSFIIEDSNIHRQHYYIYDNTVSYKGLIPMRSDVARAIILFASKLENKPTQLEDVFGYTYLVEAIKCDFKDLDTCYLYMFQNDNIIPKTKEFILEFLKIRMERCV